MDFQSIIDYIEEHLKIDLTVKELSELSHYSLFHFFRVFQKVTGLAVKQYIMRSRLIHGPYEIEKETEISTKVLEYGVDSYSSFFKAFAKE